MKESFFKKLTIENRNLREEVASNKGKIFQLESDLDYLRTTIEKNLPFFNQLEQENKRLQIEVNRKSTKEKQTDKLQSKINKMESKIQGLKKGNEKTTSKLTSENKQLEERHELVKQMNF